jgi:hypothetical protein
MARIVAVTGDSDYPNLTPGVKNINAGNVYGSTLVALATTGLTFDISLLSNYDWFNVAQTSAGTDFISLPASIAVGTVIKLYAISACKVEATGGNINGIAATTDITLAAASLSTLQKVTSTNWVLTQLSSAGAVTAPTS